MPAVVAIVNATRNSAVDTSPMTAESVRGDRARYGASARQLESASAARASVGSL